jgi:gliding motility-associated-like protein
MRLFVFLFLLFFSINQVSAQIDTLFWFVAPEVSVGNANFDNPIAIRMTTFDLPATVTISQPANLSFTPIVVNIPANNTESVDLSSWLSLIENKPANTVLNKGIKISSTANINAYYEIISSNCECNPAVFSLKGRNAIGQNFLIPSQTDINNSDFFTFTPVPYSTFEIVATENNTTVTINPSSNIIGHTAGTSFNITLNKGQTYSAKATSQSAAGHLDGSTVTSNRPITITISDDLLESYESGGIIYADIGGDQIVPTYVLGHKHIVIKGNLSTSSQERFYIMASQPNTSVIVNGATSTIANVGQTLSFLTSSNAYYIDADKPVSVLQLSGIGLEMGIEVIPPIECTGSESVAFVRSSSYTLYLNITIPTGAEDAFTFNGSTTVITAANFLTVPNTAGGWKYAKLEIPTSTLDVNEVARIENSEAYFHLGFLNGWNEKGARYGYVSNYANIHFSSTTDSICPGQQYALGNGQFVDEAGYYTYIQTSSNGCDSTFLVILNEKSAISSFQSSTLCEGSILNWNGQEISSSGNYTANIPTTFCDSIANLQIILADTFYTIQNYTVCPGNSVVINGQTLSTPGQYPSTYASIAGCDSTIVANVINQEIYIPVSQTTSICDGDTLIWFGQTISEAGAYDNIVTALGCDTLITLQVSVTTAVTSSQSISVCPGGTVIIYGDEISSSGIYPYTLEASGGCDSIVSYDITFDGQYIPTFDEAVICQDDTLTWYTQILTMEGSFQEIILSSTACDTLANLNLSVIQPISTYDSVKVCPGTIYVSNGSPITITGNYPFVLAALSGCDSISNIYVSFEEVYIEINESQNLCEGTVFNWFGQNLSIQGDYQHIGVVLQDCDTLYEITVTEIDTSIQQVNYTLCPGETLLLNGNSYTENGSYSEFFVNQNGCDSVILANVIFEETLVPYPFDVTICDNDTFFYQGQNYVSAGIYEVEINNPFGCDTLAMFEVVVSQTTFDTLNILGCPGEDLQLGSLTVSETGFYQEILTQVSGCDSIVTWHAVFGDFEVELGSDIEACSGLPINLTATTTSPQGFDLSYSWSGNQPNCVNCSSQAYTLTGSAIIEVSINYGIDCSAFDDINVSIKDAGTGAKTLFPNAFSPNDDGVNDIFSLNENSDITFVYVFRIFDRWGNEIHEEVDVEPWNLLGFNGLFRSDYFEPGVFGYYAIVESSCRGTIHLEGDVTVLK